MKEGTSYQENIDLEAISEKEKEKLNWLPDQRGLFAGEKCQVIMKMLTWNQKTYQKCTELITEPIGPFAFGIGGPFYTKDHYRGILWLKLPLLTMRVSPAGVFKKRAFKLSNLICKVRD